MAAQKGLGEEADVITHLGKLHQSNLSSEGFAKHFCTYGQNSHEVLSLKDLLLFLKEP